MDLENHESIKLYLEEHSNTGSEEIERCLKKANQVEFDGTNIFVCDNTIIYYFVSLEKSIKKKYEFYQKCYQDMKHKKFYSKDISKYKSMCRRLPEIVPHDLKKKAYIWL